VGRVPIIAITADVAPERRGAYIEAGVTALLGKPVNWKELARLLRSCSRPGTALPSRIPDVG
jgi:CheY-like chemotaxis protein